VCNGGGVAVVARALEHGYGRGRSAVRVLRGVDLDVGAGAYVALRGPSGAGKSTLLSILGGLERLQRGSISIGGTELTALRGAGLATFRRTTVGFVFQHFGLVDMLTARENVMLALALARVPAALRRRRADALLDAVGLADRAAHRPAHLSGGERQRVAVARALANAPRLILADEPTGNLDEASTQRLLDLFDAVRREHGCTLLVVTHEPAVAERADSVLRLRDGRIAA
jgi:putative ABC transport system ATP-binding protein